VAEKQPHIRFVRNEQLKTAKPNFPGNKMINGQFANGEDLYLPSFQTVLKWQLSRNPQKTEKEKDNFIPTVLPDPQIFTSKQDMLVWLGHATFLLRMNGVSFLVDPILFDSAFLKRRHPLPCSVTDIRNIDYLVLSHGHRDHLDEKSIQALAKNNPLVKALCPLTMGPLLHQMAPGLVYQEAGWYQQYNLPAQLGVEVYYLPAAHWHRRGLNDLNKVLWGSILFKSQGKLIYFAGDSAYKEHFAEIRNLFGIPDIAIMPIGAYKPSYMMQLSHMNPAEAVQAANDMSAQTFIPMHYGTFDLSDEPASEPVRLLQELAAAGKLDSQLHIPAVGERVLF
jgi:L-ascorbate metabolism protein UlaG (beta-lactamase superfamily)